MFYVGASVVTERVLSRSECCHGASAVTERVLSQYSAALLSQLLYTYGIAANARKIRLRLLFRLHLSLLHLSPWQ
jgi:hypothetical protein